MLISLTSNHNLMIHHMDVKTAVLNGEREEEIYMDKLEECMVPGEVQKVGKLVNLFMG